MEFDADEDLEIKFDGASVPDGSRKEKAGAATSFLESQLGEAAMTIKQTSEQERAVTDAKRKYNKNFFAQFAFSGEGSNKITQKALE